MKTYIKQHLESITVDNSMQFLLEAKYNGNKIVILNGFKERIDYVMSLSNVKWVGEVKSDDGYNMIQCYVC